MRALWIPLFAPALLAACEPLGEPLTPSAEDKPCQRDADCEMQAIAAPRQAFCGSVGSSPSGGSRAVDGAACGDLPNMTSKASEPSLACFRGTCVSMGSKR